MTGRNLARAARLFADQQSARFADLPDVRPLLGTVTSVSGSAVTVSWRGAELTAAAVLRSYTPGVGDRVFCVLVDSQLVVIDAT